MGLKFKLYYWPSFTAAWFCITFVTSYLIAVLDGNVYSFFPYISDTGTKPPESCIFGQMLNMAAVFMCITMYLRYIQVKNGIQLCEDTGISHKLNNWGKWCGFLASFGISLVANFQELNVPSVHFVGALMAFGLCTVYVLIQTRISAGFRKVCYKNPKYGLDQYTFYVRVFLSFWFIPLFFAQLICTGISFNLYAGDLLWWTAEGDGYQVHLAATFTEWIMSLFMFLYIVTFTKEFKAIRFKKMEFECKYI